MMVKIAQAQGSENGTTEGKVGDQTGKELYIREWYDKGWTYAVRPKSEAFANRIVKCATSLCENPHVGYSQYYKADKVKIEGRLSLEARLREINWKYENLTADCNADCSAFVKAVHNATVTKDDLRIALDRDVDSRNIKGELLATNCYLDISDAEHLKTDAKLRHGDVVGRDGHVFIVLTDPDDAPKLVEVTVKVPEEYADNFTKSVAMLFNI